MQCLVLTAEQTHTHTHTHTHTQCMPVKRGGERITYGIFSTLNVWTSWELLRQPAENVR